MQASRAWRHLHLTFFHLAVSDVVLNRLGRNVSMRCDPRFQPDNDTLAFWDMRVLQRTAKDSRKSIAETPSSPATARPASYKIFHVDAFKWLENAKPHSIHAVVTDPPYGLIEYTPRELEKMRNGRGGVWRIPPSFDGCQRKPLPRFTVLDSHDRSRLRSFFKQLAERLLPVLVPGAHVFIATNPLVSHLVYEPFIAAGFEKRGEIIRVVYTLRGGDRPKNAHKEFPEIADIRDERIFEAQLERQMMNLLGHSQSLVGEHRDCAGSDCHRKQRKLRALAETFLRATRTGAGSLGVDVRFDVASVRLRIDGSAVVEIFEDAF